MAESFKFELVSPESLLVSEDAEQVVVPGSEGEMTVLANHAPVMTTVKPGIVTVKPAKGGEDRYVVFGGFADILPESCTVLAESAVHVDNVDREEVRQRIETAREKVDKAGDGDERTAAEQFLDQLVTLEQTIIPA